MVMHIIITVIGAVLSALIALSVHELGHLIAGLAVGFRFEMFVTGFLKIYRNEQGKIRGALNKDLSLIGGVAATIPTNTNADHRKKFALVILSGPLASLIYMLMCFLLLKYTPEPWKLMLAISGASSFGIFFGTVIPNKSGLFFTDRKRFQRLISKTNDALVECALLKLLALQACDNSMKNADYQDILTMKSDKDPFILFFALYYECMYHHDHGNEELENCWHEFNEMSDKLKSPIIKAVKEELTKYIKRS